MSAAGIDVLWANDADSNACHLHEKVTGKKIIEHADIRDIDHFPKADILCGCYPCQGYSQGGSRNQQSESNYLYREFLRALQQIRPIGFVVENVDGMRFSQNQSLLAAQLTCFRLAGYRVSCDVLDAKSFGLAQDRRRLFIVGILSSLGKRYDFPEPTHGPGAPHPYRTLRDVIWDLRNAPEDSYNCEPFHWYYLSRNRWRSWSQQARCIVAHWRHVGLHPDSPPLHRVGDDMWEFEFDGPARRLSYLECAALQGFETPARFSGVRLRKLYLAIGNAVPPPLFAAVVGQLARQLSATSGANGVETAHQKP